MGIALPSLSHRSPIALPSLSHRSPIALRSPSDRSPIALRSLSDRSRSLGAVCNGHSSCVTDVRRRRHARSTARHLDNGVGIPIRLIHITYRSPVALPSLSDRSPIALRSLSDRSVPYVTDTRRV